MGDGDDEYDAEESDYDQEESEGYGDEEDEEEEGELYMTLQPNESKDIMMESERKEMMLYLQKDNKYQWRFKNKKIKNYVKSLSFDMCDPTEEGPDEQQYINKPMEEAKETDYLMDFKNDFAE